MIELSPRVHRVKPSLTLAITAQAKKLRASGIDIIDLGAGEPDFDTPAHIKQAAIDAINNGFTKYTAVDGIPELKEAIISKFKQENNLDYKAEQILVSCGGKHSFFNLIQSLIDVGDEVIIPAPYWVSYPEIVLIANGTPVFINCGIDQNFKVTPEQLNASISLKTKLFVINSPSNPTGATYSREELAALGEVLRKHPQVFVATDDMYEHIQLSTNPFFNILNVCPDLYDRTIVLNGVSKAYSMTGWRIGYAGGPKQLISAMTKIQSQSTSNPTSISQVAAQVALNSDQSFIATMVSAFSARHKFLVDALNNFENVTCLPSDGAFYSFPDFSQAIAKMDGISNDLEFCEFLINKVRIALIPGSAFGAPNFMRLSFATSMENLKLAMQRLAEVL